jgi:chemotaxis protein histidine kinase CheA
MASDGPQARRIATFRQTAGERIGRLNLAWVRFEQGETSAAAEFMREAHTLKGEASLLGFVAMKRIAHHIETLVTAALESADGVDPSVGDSVLEGLDLLGVLLDRDPDDAAPEAAAYLGEEAPAPAPTPQASKTEGRAAAPASDSVRVTTENLEGLREIVGDLFLLHSRSRGFLAELRKARQLAATSNHGQGDRLYGQLGQVLAGLESVLRDHGRQVGRTAAMLESISRDMRMVPIRVLFDSYPRAVRNLARELGKEVRLHIEGENVEVDRGVLDTIAEPLIHIVRNAIDHGIEAPGDRERAGKPIEGKLSIHANLVGSTLRIDISDDGKGINTEGVRRRVLELGLLDAEQVRQLTEDQLVSYVFHQGLSTMSAATEISGRGVGLDVVLKNIEAMGGTVTVSTRLGHGTTFRMQVPISIAVTALLTFRVGSGRYALPATSVASLIETSKASIIESASGPVIRHQGFFLPVLHLDELLGDHSSKADPNTSARTILVESAGSIVAIVGTNSHKRVEAVLKGTSEVFRHDRLIGAAAPMDDGTLALVLKPGELLAATRGTVTRTTTSTANQRGGSTVLVADDSPVIRDLLSEALRSHGLRVLEAADGEEALAVLAAHPEIRLLVTDVEMPRLDGIGLIREVRLHHGRQLPALVVSMRGTDEDKQRAIDVGADGYLVKSDFTQAGLWTMVSRYLR